MSAQYSQAANNLQFPRVRFGVAGVTPFPREELEEEQLGYSGPDWKASWLAIAREKASGDPIFVDTGHQEFPVFTAIHGVGMWEPLPVAPSLRAFSEALIFVQPFCMNREHPVGLARNPVSASERAELFNGLRFLFGHPAPAFWQELFAGAP